LLSIRSASVGTAANTTATISANVWNLICIRQSAAGAVGARWYEEDGDAVEHETLTNGENGFSGATDLAMVFGGRIAGATGTYDSAIPGEVSLMAAWSSDIGDAGCDSWANDPLNYTASNPPTLLKLYDADGDIVGTITDQSGNGKDFALIGNAAVTNNGGPTVTALNVRSKAAGRRRHR
jgi:hypothetical protein